MRFTPLKKKEAKKKKKKPESYKMFTVCNLEECCNQNLTMCQHPNTGLPTSRTVRNNFLLFISHLVYGTLLCTKTAISPTTTPWN